MLMPKAIPVSLSTEINHAVGEDAVLVHHVFKDSGALVHYFSTTATQHMGALLKVAKPELHLIRGISIPASSQGSAIGEERTWGVWRIPLWLREGRLPAPRPGDGYHGHRPSGRANRAIHLTSGAQAVVAASWY